jgi:hypothetical protein
MAELTPEERAANRAEAEKRYADWVANNPVKVAEAEKIANEKLQNFLAERKLMRETEPEKYAELIKYEPTASRDPDKVLAGFKRDLIRKEMGKEAIAKREADFAKAQAEKMAAREAERAAKAAARGK